MPHLPSLEIREGAVDRLVELYKKCVYKTGGYLTDSGDVALERVQLILNDLGMAEDNIFKERQRRENQFKAREKAKKARMEKEAYNRYNNSPFGPAPIGAGGSQIQNYKQEAALLRNAVLADEEEEEEKDNDEVRLWEDGFKDRYYESKFDVGPDNLGFRYSVALQYVRGLCWVLKYYYQGCASWNWYFPYHYAPFASDFVNINGLSTAFEKGTKPFNPLEQLMGVFPAASGSHVPKPWFELMKDPKSPIIDFYPEDFKIDLNGKKFAWQGVALLPFVDERRLFKALEPYYDKLTEDEIRRNKQGDSKLYIGPKNSKYSYIKELCKSALVGDKEIDIVIEGMKATILSADICVPLKGKLHCPISGLPAIQDNRVITVRFRDPSYLEDFIFPAVRLPKAVDPPKVLGPEDREDNYRPVIGFNRNMGGGYSANIAPGGHRMINAGLNNYNNSSGGRGGYNSYRGNSRDGNSGIAYNYNQASNHHSSSNHYGGGHQNQGGYGNQQNNHRGRGGGHYTFHNNNSQHRFNPYGRPNHNNSNNSNYSQGGGGGGNRGNYQNQHRRY